MSDTLPLVERLNPFIEPIDVFRQLRGLPHLIFLDSAMPHERLGRYSFLAADPFAYASWSAADLKEGGARTNSECMGHLRKWQEQYRARTVAGLPPFQGGTAGLFSYDLCRAFECVPRPQYDEFAVPVMALGCYDVVIAFDHVTRQGWLVSHGFPETSSEQQRARAAARLQQFQHWIRDGVPEAHSDQGAVIDAARLAPQYQVSEVYPDLTSNFTATQYREAVQRAIEYIHAGDIFQVNLSQRLLQPQTCGSWELYSRLRKLNPATFSAYFDLGDFQVVSASPERFFRTQNGRVEARPIKGTRRRQRSPEADLFTGDVLVASEKDRSENIMIVDLMRNDLSRICDPNSIQVTQLCGLEIYQYVQHLVSVVEGQLEAGRSTSDLIAATFPGGSITGAPKIRAMEIISELEPTARGPYCGSLGYVGFDGSVDLSILIRTITAGRGWWQFPVGGGIVAQSDPQLEYEETWHKAQGLLQALNARDTNH